MQSILIQTVLIFILLNSSCLHTHKKSRRQPWPLFLPLTIGATILKVSSIWGRSSNSTSLTYFCYFLSMFQRELHCKVFIGYCSLFFKLPIKPQGCNCFLLNLANYLTIFYCKVNDDVCVGANSFYTGPLNK